MKTQSLQNGRRGTGVIGMLMALVIVLILAGAYMSMMMSHEGGVAKGGITKIEESRIVACNANKQVVRSYITQWSIAHFNEKPTIERMKKDGYNVPSCPSGGTYSINEDGEIICSIHDAPPEELLEMETELEEEKDESVNQQEIEDFFNLSK